jgi:hypothetical protein
MGRASVNGQGQCEWAGPVMVLAGACGRPQTARSENLFCCVAALGYMKEFCQCAEVARPLLSSLLVLVHFNLVVQVTLTERCSGC